MKHGRATMYLAAVLTIAILPQSLEANRPKQIALTAIARYNGGGFEGAEIAAYDPATKRIFGINAALRQVDVLDISNPAVPELAFTIPLGGRPNSVALHKGLVAVAVENREGVVVLERAPRA